MLTPVGFRVRMSRQRWELITTAKHPVLAGREGLVRTALEAPDEIRQSRIDKQVLLFYRARGDEALDVRGREAGWYDAVSRVIRVRGVDRTRRQSLLAVAAVEPRFFLGRS